VISNIRVYIKDTEWSVLFGWRLLQAPQLNDMVFTSGDKSRVSRMKNNWTDAVKMASNNTTYIHTSMNTCIYTHTRRYNTGWLKKRPDLRFKTITVGICYGEKIPFVCVCLKLPRTPGNLLSCGRGFPFWSNRLMPFSSERRIFRWPTRPLVIPSL